MCNFFACPYCSLEKDLLNRPTRWDCDFEVRDFHLIDDIPVLPAIFFHAALILLKLVSPVSSLYAVNIH